MDGPYQSVADHGFEILKTLKFLNNFMELIIFDLL